MGVLVHSTTEAQFRESEYFNREDSLLGYKAIVLRRSDTQDQNQCVESWIASDIGGEALKVDTPCGGSRQTREATDIKLGEPIFAVPDYPVDKMRFEKLTSAVASP
jgi:hypothetical protein